MKKKDLKYTFKMILKTGLLALPLFAVAFSAFAPQREQTNVELNYKYQTNEVESINDVVEGNIYHFVINDIDGLFFDDYFYGRYLDITILGINNFNYSYRYDPYIDEIIKNYSGFYVPYVSNVSFDFEENTAFMTFGSYGSNYFSLAIEGFSIQSLDCYCIFNDFNVWGYEYDIVEISKCPLEYIPIQNVDIVKTNPTMESQLIDFSNQFLDIPINSWYRDLVSAVGLSLPTNLMLVVFIYPLYILWVELFDVMLHCFLMLTELAHKLLGEKD